MHFIRKTKINELPQLINILIGDMSIIGPRPLVDKTFAPYPEHVKAVIYNVKPGLTSIGSIVFRDEEDFEGAMRRWGETVVERSRNDKGELELWYQRNLSFSTDLMLIFLTAWAIVAPQSELVYSVFKDLPERPEELRRRD